MRVKKFEAKSMKEALVMIKRELGPEAVILAARENRRSFGLGGDSSVEVTAAISEGTLQKKQFVESRMRSEDREKFAVSAARAQKAVIDKMVDRRVAEHESRQPRAITAQSYIDIDDDTNEVEKAFPRAPRAVGNVRGQSVSALLDREEAQRRPVAAAEVDGMVREDYATRSAPRITPSAAPRTAPPAARHAAQAVVAAPPLHAMTATPTAFGASQAHAYTAGHAAADRDIAVLRSEIERLQSALDTMHRGPVRAPASLHPGAEYGLSFELSSMFQKLTEAGLSAENAVEILTQASEAIDPIQIRKRAVVDAWVARWLLDHIDVVSTPQSPRGAAKLQLMLGASGSGKTSQLVKIASQLVVQERRRVAILTTDTRKVGAADQLKIYCQILNVPFAIIRNRRDWDWVATQLNSFDHMLVDYPGLQLRDLDELQFLRSVLPPEALGATAHLCISATTKDSDAFEMARRYEMASISDLIFTGLDQSVQHGLIYNLHRKTGKPLHSFGLGSRIPDDFEMATKERVLDLIFKLTKLRREAV